MLMSNFRRNYFYWGGGQKQFFLSGIRNQDFTHGNDSDTVCIFLSYKYLPTLILGVGGVSTDEINYDIHGYIFTHI